MYMHKFAILSMNSPGIPVGDGVRASEVVSDTGVTAIVVVDGSGSAVINISEIIYIEN